MEVNNQVFKEATFIQMGRRGGDVEVKKGGGMGGPIFMYGG